MDVQTESSLESVKHGRRRHAEGGSEPAPPGPPQRASGAAGWGEGGGGGGGAAAASSAPAVEEPAVTVIRDGDEAAEAAEQLASTVADAPRNTGRRMATLKELEREGLGGGAGSLNVAASRAEGIDLSLLTASLYPPEALVEADEVINWEVQLQKITQELRQEGEARDGEDMEGEGPPGGGASQEARGTPARKQ